MGKDDFDEVFKNSSQNVSSENFRALILITNDDLKLGMILPKKNIKLPETFPFEELFYIFSKI